MNPPRKKGGFYFYSMRKGEKDVMIYFDNAATNGFHPSSVTEAAVTAIKHLSANPGRSGHRLSVAGAEIVYNARKEIAAFFGLSHPERVIFTKNCTEALNTAIFGTVKEGSHVITTCYEHNSVLRPLFFLAKAGKIRLDIVTPAEGQTLTERIAEVLRKNTCLVAVNHISNVTGQIQPVREIGALLKGTDTLFLVDAAQSAGHVPIDMEALGIDLLAFAGHKGMYGIAGSGGLLIREGADVRPLTMGGTGTESLSLDQPRFYPERLESGTLNLPAIAALSEGAHYIATSMPAFSEQLTQYTNLLVRELSAFSAVTLYSKPNPAGIVAFNLMNLSSEEGAEILSNRFDIAVRGGLHCAPLMHRAIGTERTGAVRVSLSPHNTVREIRILLNAVRRMTLS